MYSQVVMSCLEGSPADRAGIHEGDELMEINGMSMFNSWVLIWIYKVDVQVASIV